MADELAAAVAADRQDAAVGEREEGRLRLESQCGHGLPGVEHRVVVAGRRLRRVSNMAIALPANGQSAVVASPHEGVDGNNLAGQGPTGGPCLLVGAEKLARGIHRVAVGLVDHKQVTTAKDHGLGRHPRDLHQRPRLPAARRRGEDLGAGERLPIAVRSPDHHRRPVREDQRGRPCSGLVQAPGRTPGVRSGVVHVHQLAPGAARSLGRIVVADNQDGAIAHQDRVEPGSLARHRSDPMPAQLRC